MTCGYHNYDCQLEMGSQLRAQRSLIEYGTILYLVIVLLLSYQLHRTNVVVVVRTIFYEMRLLNIYLTVFRCEYAVCICVGLLRDTTSCLSCVRYVAYIHNVKPSRTLLLLSLL